MKLTHEEELELRAGRIRAKRQRLQREIADALLEQQAWYAKLKPAAATAKLYQSATRTQHLDRTNPVSVDVAERLDISTPTGQFEQARAMIEHFSGIVSARRRAEKKLAAELDRIREELGRIKRAAGGPVPGPHHAPWGALAAVEERRSPLQARLPAGAGERVDALRALARDARAGVGLFQRVA